MSVEQEFWKTQQEQLEQKLSEFEECVETPFVPGELEDWLHATREAWEELTPQMQLQTQYIHAQEFAEIAEEDPGLFSRVAEMREEDQNLATQSEELSKRLDSIQKRFESGATETDLKQDLDEFVSTSLEYLLRFRKQELTMRTWLVEAFTRDRGTVD